MEYIWALLFSLVLYLPLRAVQGWLGIFPYKKRR
ncbi:hypothetical protein SAMN05421790_105158 [Kroppenstedtia eburnea]|uniref:Uncharacterized protein n=1 Tax=Kroppenstedtia eburnea TaxID=714067 RepID=A0A1N7M2G1_9BACL|nr:hypothetical protein SAMN05421790_105158 [Kroppenstedtia eburnea]